MKKKIFGAVIFLMLFSVWAYSQTVLRDVYIQIGLGTLLTGTQGNSGIVQQAGTISGTSVLLCTDSNGNVTTSSCSLSAFGFTLVSLGTNSSVCTTSTSAGATCTTSVTISPTQANTSYIANCTGVSPTGTPYITAVSKGTGSITVTISNGQGSQATAVTYGELDCSAIHP